MKSPEELLREDGAVTSGTSTTDIAAGPGMRIQPEMSFRDLPCFKLHSEAELSSFAQGIKKFRTWRQHTQSENVRKWANENRGKDFYVTHGERYMRINRKKS